MVNKEIAESLDGVWKRMEEDGFSCENYFKEDRLIHANALKTSLIREATITKLIPLNEDDFIGKVVAEIVKLSFTELLVQIDKQPTIDAVEVVFCKNCKRWDKEDSGTKHSPNNKFCEIMRGRTSPLNFCCWGERREE